MYRTKQGGIAVLVFKTQECANVIRDMKGSGLNWILVDKTIDEMYEWGENAKGQGVTHVIPEQENMGDLSDVHVLPINSFLLSLDLLRK